MEKRILKSYRGERERILKIENKKEIITPTIININEQIILYDDIIFDFD